MDSSGISLILGRMRELGAVNGQNYYLKSFPNTMKKIFKFSGLSKYVMEGNEKEAILYARGIVNG